MIDAYLVSAIWIIPALTALFCIFVPKENHLLIKKINVAGTGLNLLNISYLCVKFAIITAPGISKAKDGITTLYFTHTIPWFDLLNIEYKVGVDGISILMLLLTSVVLFCAIFASWNIVNQAKEFFVLLNVLAAGAFGTFLSFDLFTLFLFYEVAVFPMYLLIGIWGTGFKEYSAMKLTLMLVAGSALIFGGILGLYFEYGNITGTPSFDILKLAQVDFPEHFQFWAFPVLFVGFGLLSGLFPLHTWSPDGHSSAPTAISMVHAGVLMKLGGYGCLRVAMYLLPDGCVEWMPFFLILVTINVVYGAFSAIKQTDLKYVTAYSSVSHCGLVLFGFAALTLTGLQGAVLQMVAHGFMTALFFCLIGMIYERTHTRTMSEMGGLMKPLPFLGVAFVIAGFAGLGLPGLAGFVAEITIFIGGFVNTSPINRVCTVLAILSIVLTSVYILRMTNTMLGGPVKKEFAKLKDATFIEKVPVVVLLFCLFGMGILPGWIAKIARDAVEPIFFRIMG